MKLLMLLLIILSILTSCTQQTEEEEETVVKTPVEIVRIRKDTFSLIRTFKGITHYLTDGNIHAPISGYVTRIHIKTGDKIHKGSPLFTIQTKESFVLKGRNFLNDPSLKNIGSIVIQAYENGIVTSVYSEENEYAQEGSVLGSFSAPDMFVFLIEVPAEQDTIVKIGKPCSISLPDGRIIHGRISSTLASADSLSQTEKFVVLPDCKMVLPGNLQLNISFQGYRNNHAQSLPAKAVLSNETQTEFWVMKLISDSVAVKIPVTPGIINDHNEIEIKSPVFLPDDRIINKGAYGLPDTALVILNTQGHAAE